MFSNYPEGSMMGSGIYAEEFERTEFCETCDKDVDLTFVTNDWQTEASATCECGAEFDIEIDNEPDPDEAYERMRDEDY